MGSGSSSGRQTITIITHQAPIGRGHTNYTLHADLSEREAGWREQLWTRQIAEDRFEVAWHSPTVTRASYSRAEVLKLRNSGGSIAANWPPIAIVPGIWPRFRKN